MAGSDEADPFSRDRPLAEMTAFAKARLGVPRLGNCSSSATSVRSSLWRSGQALGRAWCGTDRIDLEPFYETARLLYEGPWVAERFLVIARSAGVLTGCHPSGHPGDHPRPGAADRRRHLRGALPASRRCAGSPNFASRDSTRSAADRADRLFTVAGAGRPGRAQQPARHLHQFCQPARPLRPRAARRDAPDDIPFGITLLAPAGKDALLAASAAPSMPTPG